MTRKKPGKENICIIVTIQHGCLTEEPLCLLMKREEDERSLSGKKLMERRGLLKECQLCLHFRLCWTDEAYKKAVKSSERRKDYILRP
jgi:hypothetical protein